jgi:hypothetical protein
MFEPEYRDEVREGVLRLADADARVVAAAVVGGLAHGSGDRWSDLDLTFGVEDGVPVMDVLEDWTSRLEDEFDAVSVLDLWRDTSVYRVFLFPGCLQVDLSFTPAADFGPRGLRFRLLFGTAGELREAAAPSAADLFGLAVHHAVRARYCIERGRAWQAEYWISALRDHALERACLARGLEHAHGRGFDQLPADVRARFEPALVRSFAPDQLLYALHAAVSGLLAETDDVAELAARVEPRLRGLSA